MDFEKIKWDILAEEGITEKDLKMVDLDIGYSPVIAIKGGKPMEVIKLQGNLYRVPECLFVGYNLTETEIKIMRLRYLLNR